MDGGEGDRCDVRRPMNAFLIFCKGHRSIVREKNPDLDNKGVTRILADLWNNLKEEEKVVYTDFAKEYKDVFMKTNPDFRWYKPKKFRRSKKSHLPLAKPTNAKVTQGEVNPSQQNPILRRMLAEKSLSMERMSQCILCENAGSDTEMKSLHKALVMLGHPDGFTFEQALESEIPSFSPLGGKYCLSCLQACERVNKIKKNIEDLMSRQTLTGHDLSKGYKRKAASEISFPENNMKRLRIGEENAKSQVQLSESEPTKYCLADVKIEPEYEIQTHVNFESNTESPKADQIEFEVYINPDYFVKEEPEEEVQTHKEIVESQTKSPKDFSAETCTADEKKDPGFEILTHINTENDSRKPTAVEVKDQLECLNQETDVNLALTESMQKSSSDEGKRLSINKMQSQISEVNLTKNVQLLQFSPTSSCEVQGKTVLENQMQNQTFGVNCINKVPFYTLISAKSFTSDGKTLPVNQISGVSSVNETSSVRLSGTQSVPGNQISGVKFVKRISSVRFMGTQSVPGNQISVENSVNAIPSLRLIGTQSVHGNQISGVNSVSGLPSVRFTGTQSVPENQISGVNSVSGMPFVKFTGTQSVPGSQMSGVNSVSGMPFVRFTGTQSVPGSQMSGVNAVSEMPSVRFTGTQSVPGNQISGVNLATRMPLLQIIPTSSCVAERKTVSGNQMSVGQLTQTTSTLPENQMQSAVSTANNLSNKLLFRLIPTSLVKGNEEMQHGISRVNLEGSVQLSGNTDGSLIADQNKLPENKIQSQISRENLRPNLSLQLQKQSSLLAGNTVPANQIQVQVLKVNFVSQMMQEEQQQLGSDSAIQRKVQVQQSGDDSASHELVKMQPSEDDSASQNLLQEKLSGVKSASQKQVQQLSSVVNSENQKKVQKQQCDVNSESQKQVQVQQFGVSSSSQKQVQVQPSDVNSSSQKLVQVQPLGVNLSQMQEQVPQSGVDSSNQKQVQVLPFSVHSSGQNQVEVQTSGVDSSCQKQQPDCITDQQMHRSEKELEDQDSVLKSEIFSANQKQQKKNVLLRKDINMHKKIISKLMFCKNFDHLVFIAFRTELVRKYIEEKILTEIDCACENICCKDQLLGHLLKFDLASSGKMDINIFDKVIQEMQKTVPFLTRVLRAVCLSTSFKPSTKYTLVMMFAMGMHVRSPNMSYIQQLNTCLIDEYGSAELLNLLSKLSFTLDNEAKEMLVQRMKNLKSGLLANIADGNEIVDSGNVSAIGENSQGIKMLPANLSEGVLPAFSDKVSDEEFMHFMNKVPNCSDLVDFVELAFDTKEIKNRIEYVLLREIDGSCETMCVKSSGRELSVFRDDLAAQKEIKIDLFEKLGQEIMESNPFFYNVLKTMCSVKPTTSCTLAMIFAMGIQIRNPNMSYLQQLNAILLCQDRNFYLLNMLCKLHFTVSSSAHRAHLTKKKELKAQFLADDDERKKKVSKVQLFYSLLPTANKFNTEKKNNVVQKTENTEEKVEESSTDERGKKLCKVQLFYSLLQTTSDRNTNKCNAEKKNDSVQTTHNTEEKLEASSTERKTVTNVIDKKFSDIIVIGDSEDCTSTSKEIADANSDTNTKSLLLDGDAGSSSVVVDLNRQTNPEKNADLTNLEKNADLSKSQHLNPVVLVKPEERRAAENLLNKVSRELASYMGESKPKKRRRAVKDCAAIRPYYETAKIMAQEEYETIMKEYKAMLMSIPGPDYKTTHTWNEVQGSSHGGAQGGKTCRSLIRIVEQYEKLLISIGRSEITPRIKDNILRKIDETTD